MQSDAISTNQWHIEYVNWIGMNALIISELLSLLKLSYADKHTWREKNSVEDVRGNRELPRFFLNDVKRRLHTFHWNRLVFIAFTVIFWDCYYYIESPALGETF